MASSIEETAEGLKVEGGGQVLKEGSSMGLPLIVPKQLPPSPWLHRLSENIMIFSSGTSSLCSMDIL